MTPDIAGIGGEADFGRRQIEGQRRVQEVARQPEPEPARKEPTPATRDLAHVRREATPVRMKGDSLRDDDLAVAAAHAARDSLRGEPKVATIVHGRATAQRAVDLLL